MEPVSGLITWRAYRNGDALAIPVAEKDPSDGWLEELEREGCGLTTYEVGGNPVAVIGYQLLWPGVAYATALVNRSACKGHGKELAALVKARIRSLMDSDRLHRVQASANPKDRASVAFLRATGYRLESVMRRASPEGNDLLMFTIIRSNDK